MSPAQDSSDAVLRRPLDLSKSRARLKADGEAQRVARA